MALIDFQRFHARDFSKWYGVYGLLLLIIVPCTPVKYMYVVYVVVRTSLHPARQKQHRCYNDEINTRDHHDFCCAARLAVRCTLGVTLFS